MENRRKEHQQINGSWDSVMFLEFILPRAACIPRKGGVYLFFCYRCLLRFNGSRFLELGFLQGLRGKGFRSSGVRVGRLRLGV